MNALERFHNIPQGSPQGGQADAIRQLSQRSSAPTQHYPPQAAKSPVGMQLRGQANKVERPRFNNVLVLHTGGLSDSFNMSLKSMAEMGDVQHLHMGRGTYPHLQPNMLRGVDLIVVNDNAKLGAETLNNVMEDMAGDVPTTVPAVVSANANPAQLHANRPTSVVPYPANEAMGRALLAASDGRLTAAWQARKTQEEVRAKMFDALPSSFGPQEPLVLRQLNPLIASGAITAMEQVRKHVLNMVGKLEPNMYEAMKQDLRGAVLRIVPDLHSAEQATSYLEVQRRLRRMEQEN